MMVFVVLACLLAHLLASVCFFSMLWVEPGLLHMLDKHSATELVERLSFYLLF